MAEEMTRKQKKPTNWYTADFETTTDPDNCHVWAWSVCDENLNKEFGTNIAEFLQLCAKLAPCKIWFHNLRFDAQFIVSWLLRNGYKYDPDKRENTFNCLVNDTNQIYSLEIIYKIYWSNKRKHYKAVKFMDSLKKLPFKVETVAKTFKLPIKKLDLDYTTYREYGHELSKHEIEYIANDVEIMARALSQQFSQGLDRLTIGSDCMNSYKATIGGENQFRRYFPELDLETDKDMRSAYKGGWCYVNPKYQEKDLGQGMVFDVNSLYPWALRYNPYPIGIPIYFYGKYQQDDLYPLYIQRLMCSFKIKDGYLPTIQIKKSLLFLDTEYITEAIEPVVLTLSNIDLEIFFEHYDVTVYEWICGYKFRAKDGLFNKYIDYWGHLKENSTGGMRQLCKLMLNNCYGKFATNPLIVNKRPELDENEVVKWVVDKSEYVKPVYLPVGIFCTAYARRKTIQMAQLFGDRFVYADTDSVHVLGREIPTYMQEVVDDKLLGYWKHESDFERARFIKPKTYIEEELLTQEKYYALQEEEFSNLNYERDGKYYHLNVKCAGMNDAIKEDVTWDNFHRGYESNKKLKPKNVRGGVILEEIPFTIK